MRADTGFPRTDVENDFLRVRRRQVLARLAGRLRRGPDDVNLILPFDEVIAALGFRGEQLPGAAHDQAGRGGRHRGLTARLRPPVPADHGPGPGALGAAGAGPAARRVHPAHRRLPGRRPVLRPGRPPPGVDRHGHPAAHHRRLRDPGPDRDPGRGHPWPQRPGDEELPADLPGPGAAPGGRLRQADLHRPVVLRRAGGERRGLGLPLHAGRAGVPHPRADRPPLVQRGVHSRWSACCTRPT